MDEKSVLELKAPLPVVDRATLERHARAAIGRPVLRIGDWQVTHLSAQGRRSVFRFAGLGHDGPQPQPWSVVLKVLRAPAAATSSDLDVRDWAYWPRESLLYEAGIPQQLAGALRAPRCFGVAQPAADVRWIWLEDLKDSYNGVWPLSRYSLAARHLGAFNGSYLAGRSLPSASWLSRDGLRSRTAAAAAGAARLLDPTVWAQPVLQRAFPRPVVDQFRRLLADRERFLDARMRLPQTFCHLDAWQGNMCAVENPAGADTTVLFDWALAGYGAAGEEISNLIWTTFLEFKLDVADAPRLEAAVFESYLAGLGDVGWRGDPQDVRRAYLINAVLYFGLAPEALDHALNEAGQSGLAQRYGWSLDSMIEQAARVTYLMFERADELRVLLAGHG